MTLFLKLIPICCLNSHVECSLIQLLCVSSLLNCWLSRSHPSKQGARPDKQVYICIYLPTYQPEHGKQTTSKNVRCLRLARILCACLIGSKMQKSLILQLIIRPSCSKRKQISSVLQACMYLQACISRWMIGIDPKSFVNPVDKMLFLVVVWVRSVFYELKLQSNSFFLSNIN